MPEIEDAGFEVPPAPWEFGGEAGGEVGIETGGEVTGNDGLGVAGADIGETDSGGSGGTGESTGKYGENPELVYFHKWNGGAGESSGEYGDNPELAYSQNGNSGADYNPYLAQDYSSEKLGSDPELVYYGAYQRGSPYYDVPEFQAGNAPGGYSQGEGWKIMRDQYNAAGLGAGGTAPEPQNRWDAATLPNLLAWGAGYGNAMGQTSQETSEWVNQSIEQWNSAHPDNQYPPLPPVVGPKMPAQPIDKQLTQTDVPWYDPKSGRWIQPDSTARDASGNRDLEYSKYDKTLAYMYDQMIRNVNSRQVKSIQELLDFTGNPSLARYGNSAQYFIAAMSEWASMVGTGQEWDHKPQLDRMLGLAEANDYYFPIRGDTEHKYYYNIWSNIHYGYVGSAAGFDAEMLHRGGDSKIPFTPFDYDPTSAISIQIGIDLWNQKSTALRPEDIQQAILAHKQDYLSYPKVRTVIPRNNGG